MTLMIVNIKVRMVRFLHWLAARFLDLILGRTSTYDFRSCYLLNISMAQLSPGKPAGQNRQEDGEELLREWG